jgi:CheY-like chemotaxis protein
MPPRASVLIVDDAADSREMYAEYLAFKGFVVNTADNGRDGLMKASRETPDVVVLDLTMPGIDGLQVIRTLRADPRTARIFVIVVTAHALKGTEDEVRTAGADVYLAKPCFPADLEKAIETRRLPGRRRS